MYVHLSAQGARAKHLASSPHCLLFGLPPRGANMTRATDRTMRTACVQLFLPAPVPVQPRVSCCGVGRSVSAVSASPLADS